MFYFRSFMLSLLACIFLSVVQSTALAKKVLVELIPIEQEVQIRVGKETIEFDVLIQNREESVMEFDVWMTVKKQGEITWPVSGPISVTLGKGESIHRHRL